MLQLQGNKKKWVQHSGTCGLAASKWTPPFRSTHVLTGDTKGITGCSNLSMLLITARISVKTVRGTLHCFVDISRFDPLVFGLVLGRVRLPLKRSLACGTPRTLVVEYLPVQACP